MRYLTNNIIEYYRLWVLITLVCLLQASCACEYGSYDSVFDVSLYAKQEIPDPCASNRVYVFPVALRIDSAKHIYLDVLIRGQDEAQCSQIIGEFVQAIDRSVDRHTFIHITSSHGTVIPLRPWTPPPPYAMVHYSSPPGYILDMNDCIEVIQPVLLDLERCIDVNETYNITFSKQLIDDVLALDGIEALVQNADSITVATGNLEGNPWYYYTAAGMR